MSDYKNTYRFSHEYRGYHTPNQRVVVEVDAPGLPELLSAFEDFLRGTGHSFSGHLDIVEDPDLEPYTEEIFIGDTDTRVSADVSSELIDEE